jgi:hypothetical protein
MIYAPARDWAQMVIDETSMLPAGEPDRQISRIRLSDKTSRLHPRHEVGTVIKAYRAIDNYRYDDLTGSATQALKCLRAMW